jgi:Tfp pilus assembly protein PilF
MKGIVRLAPLALLVFACQSEPQKPPFDTEQMQRGMAMLKLQDAVNALSQGELSTAREHARACLENNPAMCECLRLIAQTNQGLNEFANAIASYEEYLAKCPNQQDISTVRQAIDVLREKAANP